MKKIEEDETYVSYCFEKDIWVKTGEKDRRGFPIAESKTIIGVCTFNKVTREFTVDKQKTDPYYFEKHHSEIKWVEGRLQRFQTLNEGYPQNYMIAYG